LANLLAGQTNSVLVITAGPHTDAVAKLSFGGYRNLATSASPELTAAVTNFLS
jgi:hypothetical protein